MSEMIEEDGFKVAKETKKNEKKEKPLPLLWNHNPNDPKIILPTRQLYRAVIKYTKEEKEQVLFFDQPVHVGSNMLTGNVGIYQNDDDKCLLLTHFGLVDYCHVAASGEVPELLTKRMNIPNIDKECQGCVFRGHICHNPKLCNREPGMVPSGYTLGPEEK